MAQNDVTAPRTNLKDLEVKIQKIISILDEMDMLSFTLRRQLNEIHQVCERKGGF